MKKLIFSSSIPLLLLFVLTPIAFGQDPIPPAWQVNRWDISASLPTTGRDLTVHAVLSLHNIGGAGSTVTMRLNPKIEVKSATVNDTVAQFRSSTEKVGNLQRIQLTLATRAEPGATIKVSLDYRFPVEDNSGVAAISPIGSGFLPQSSWYPTPNTLISALGSDSAPFTITVSGPGSEMIVSSGKITGSSADQSLYGQPFFLTGSWDLVDGAGETSGVSALIPKGSGADERKQAAALMSIASNARSYFSSVLGQPANVPIRLVASQRGAGINVAGTILLDPSVFRRTKPDAITAMTIAESVARMWIGGMTPVRGENSGLLQQGLVRFLATLFLEKQFGKDAAEAERTRERLAYVGVSKRDAPLTQSLPVDDVSSTSITNKGAMIWRLLDHLLTRDSFFAIVRGAFESARGEKGISFSAFRAFVIERGGDSARALLEYGFDKVTDMDLMVGLPQQQAGGWTSALRNLGSADASVNVIATTDRGERVSTEIKIPARDFATATFNTASKVIRVEVDPEKFYPQFDYSNDMVPRVRSGEDALAEATRLFNLQQFANAELIVRELISASPQMQEAHVLLGRALVAQNKLDDALKEFRGIADAALPMPGPQAWASVGIGQIAQRRNQNSEASSKFSDAIRADADSAATLLSRAERIKVESIGGASPIDQAGRAFVAQFDLAIKSGPKSDLESMIVSGELALFVKGILSARPESWQTRILRTELITPSRMLIDVYIEARQLGKDQAGPAILVLAQVGGVWKLNSIDHFEVR